MHQRPFRYCESDKYIESLDKSLTVIFDQVKKQLADDADSAMPDAHRDIAALNLKFPNKCVACGRAKKDITPYTNGCVTTNIPICSRRRCMRSNNNPLRIPKKHQRRWYSEILCIRAGLILRTTVTAQQLYQSMADNGIKSMPACYACCATIDEPVISCGVCMGPTFCSGQCFLDDTTTRRHDCCDRVTMLDPHVVE
jgi:hypothetical protein